LYSRAVPDIEDIKKAIQKITPADIAAMAHEVFADKASRFAVIGPLPDADKKTLKTILTG